MRKKIAIISPRFPYPLEKGDKLRMFHQIKTLSNHFDVHLFALSDIEIDNQDRKALSAFCSSIDIFLINGKWNIMKGLFSKAPFQSSYYYNKKIHRKISKRIDHINPDNIYYQLVRTSKYLVNHPAKKTIDLMDCFSKGYQLRANEELGFKSWLYQMESNRLKLQEKNAIHSFDQLCVISEQDAKSLGVADNSTILPNGIDTSFFRAESSSRKTKDVVFVGNLGYEPNVYAVEFLKTKVFPLVKSEIPNVQFSIAGARPIKRVKMLHNTQFEVKGWMDDIRDAYNESKIFVAPIFGGIGQQNKVLEAMAMQLPCIVSPAVAKGLDIPNVSEFLSIADSADSFAEQIMESLSGNEEIRKKCSAALAYVQNERSWLSVNKSLVDLFL